MTPFILDTDEHVIRIVRKSIILFCLQVIGFVFVSILPVFLLSFGIKYFELSFSDSTQQIVRVILATWILFVWVSLFIRFTNYYLDSWVITNKRIVDIDQKSLFTRTTATLNLDKIQDVRVEVGGLLRTVLGIGTIHIQTAGSETVFVIPDASSPEGVKTTIINLYHSVLAEPKTVKIQN